ncbi:hypothetical protein C3L33_07074, partial [Rhododendron williamsianum]
MASFRPFFNNFISLLLIHLGCFFLTSNPHHHHSKKQKGDASLLSHSSPSLKRKTTKVLSSSWSFLKRIIVFTHKPTATRTHPNPDSSTAATTPPPSSSLVCLLSPDSLDSDPPLKRPSTASRPESDISSHQQFYPLRNDIYPCPACGEIFLKPNLLEHHQTVKHAVSELHDSDSSKNIVQIIFNTGWPGKIKTPNVIRVLKIRNSPKILTRFEEYRESVKLKAAVRRRDERCVADGNELLRFHCATFLCDLGRNGSSSVCGQQYCSVCGIIKSGFSHKVDGIATTSTSWRAHAAIPEEIEEEFGFMHVKRAMLVCRVVAGRVGCDAGYVDKEDSGFDSVVVGKGPGAARGVVVRLDEEDELLVFNPRAVLPCFVIVYAV